MKHIHTFILKNDYLDKNPAPIIAACQCGAIIEEPDINSMINTAVNLSGFIPAKPEVKNPIYPPVWLTVPHMHNREVTTGNTGATCAAMIVNALTQHEITPKDVVAQAAPQNQPMFTWQVMQACQYYGLRVEYKRPLHTDEIAECIRAGKPVIALVQYSLLRHNDLVPYSLLRRAHPFKGASFIVIYGVSGEGDRFFCRDPLDEKSGETPLTAVQLETAMTEFDKGEHRARQGIVVWKETS